MPKGLKPALATLAIAPALYSLLGFLVLPGVALQAINRQLPRFITQPAGLERLEFNPFTLELTLHRLRLGEAGSEQLAFERLYGKLHWDSLWRNHLHLAEVRLERPQVAVLFDQQGGLNLARLFKLPAPAPARKDRPAGAPFPLHLDRFLLSDGQVHFQDRRPSEPVEVRYDTLSLEAHHLGTLPNDTAELNLQASGKHVGRIAWSGQLSLVPLRSSGKLGIDQAGLRPWWPYVRDAAPLVLEDGTLSLSSDYRLELTDSLRLQLQNAALKLAPFALAAPDGRPLARLQSLELGQASLDLTKRQVSIGQLQGQGLETWAAREADGALDWQKLFAPRSTGQPPSGRAGAGDVKTKKPDKPDKPDKAPDKSWQILLADARLRGSRLHLADRVPAQHVELQVGPLDLALRNFDSLGQTPFRLELNSGIGRQGRLEAAGQVRLSPLAAQLQIDSRDLDLRPAQAYIAPFIRLELRSGQLDSSLKIDLKGGERLALQVDGRAAVKQLHTLDTLKNRDFVKWRQLTLENLSYRHGERLGIERIVLEQPYTRFIVNENLSTNVSELLIAQGQRQPAQMPPSRAAKPTEQPAAPPLGIHVGTVEIKDGSANFADFSLKPNFATAIQQLNGRIGSLDNRQSKPATVDVKGRVDRYAPVSIKGSLNPLDPLESLDIATRFQRVELTTLTPYSGKFAGYRIRKGRLNLDLHYRIEKGLLNAENSLVLEQLQLGERVDSPDAVDLPIRLAVALLKDSQGRIAIDLPLKGDLNNPEFRVMPIVWQTLRNLVTRTAQAPFKFIVGLLDSGETDLSQVEFSPGSSALDAAAQRSLDTLGKVLKERPQLRLEVEGMSAQASDGPLLAEQRLEREYRNGYYRLLQERGERVPASTEGLKVPEEEEGPLLEGIYRSRLKHQPPAEWGGLDQALRAARLREAVLASWDDSMLLLRQLAQARAASIKAYLVERGGLEDQRIYQLDVSVSEAPAGARVGVPLQLASE
ncbi:DUF748 domain-containing protein [Azotobacter beijerinckii]|uniref:Uncharacterized protein involved in outer membrane biogenesis n=1 Tax=Azotobacter beijerinckii TaxID=170623 RepID=A0A1I4BDR1_9GAMM|nr:DUF748 domain-containing protein [Azotobacter beijerinckii]SFB13527.1 Uncharacterized protein involved in outer membrane biogenesis [Azotobacter beijerinckii]SFK66663.1 Uncharacterized protein involved in outer membrane biogenesis [Azotobacter beijerinckii]